MKESTFLQNNIATFRLDKYKGRPTIIFLHDSLGCIQLWRDFPQKLGEMARCNVLVYDRQGYGKSCDFITPKRDNYYMEAEADILIDLLDFWQVENPILFGHSDGGSIALIAGGKYLKRIKGIITEGAHIFVEDETLIGIREAIELYKTTDLKSKLEKYHSDKTEKMFWAWAETWTTKEFRTWNIESFVRTIECDLLIIQGEDDEYGTIDQVNGIVNQTQGRSTKLMLPNVRHTPHKEDQEFILMKAAEFINQLTDQ